MISTYRADHPPLSLYFNITDYCNSGCTFCAANVPGLKNPSEIPPEYILQIYEHHNLGPGDDVVINGGEPTVYRNLEIVIHEAVSRGAKVILFTNGRVLGHFSKAQALLGAGVNRVSIPLHGGHDDTHDRLTRRQGSFKQTMAGIHNAFTLRNEFGFPEEIELKMLAVRDSLREWPEIIELIAEELGIPDILVMSGLNMWSTATHSYKLLSPTIGQVQEYVNLSLQKAFSFKMSVTFWAIPLCLLTLENLERFVSPTKRLKSLSRRRVIYFDSLVTEGIEHPDEEFSLYQEVEPQCRECYLARICGPGRVFFQQLLAISD